MKIRVLFTVFLLALSFALSANKTPQIDSTNSQEGQETIVPAQEKESGTILSVQEDNVFSEKEPGNLAQIRDNTKETADNTKKGGYETLTIILSVLAFVIAIVTMFYTIRTYRSQKETQKNTTPLFTKEKQHEVLMALSERLLENYLEICVARIKMEKSKNNIPSELVFSAFHIDSSELHLELFYNESYDKEVVFMYRSTEYAMMSYLKSLIDQYNNWCQIINTHIMQKSLDYDILKQEVDFRIIRKLLNIIEHLSVASNKIFKDKIEIRNHLVKYIWARKNISEHYGKEKTVGDAYDEVTKKSLDRINLLSKDYWEHIYKDFNFANLSTLEKDFDIFKLISYIDYIVLWDLINKEKSPTIKFDDKKMKRK